jgi:hypothetical protein
MRNKISSVENVIINYRKNGRRGSNVSLEERAKAVKSDDGQP